MRNPIPRIHLEVRVGVVEQYDTHGSAVDRIDYASSYVNRVLPRQARSLSYNISISKLLSASKPSAWAFHTDAGVGGIGNGDAEIGGD